MKENIAECQELTKVLYKLMPKVENSVRQQQLVQLLDTCSKNGTALFHRCLATDKFTNLFINQLRLTRNKVSKLKLKVMKLPERLRREASEKMLMGLI